MGAGVQTKIDVTSKNEQETTGEAFLLDNNGNLIPNPDLNRFETRTIENDFINFQTGIFIGINLGTVRIGPSVGVRYVQYFDQPNSQIQFYGIWKF